MTSRSDNYNRADASSLGTPSGGGSAWVTPQGDLFSIVSNQAAGGGATRAINYLECDTADGTLTVTKATHAASSYGGLIFRLVDNDNYWFFRTQPSNYGLAKIVAGAETGVGTPAGTPTSGDVLSVELSDDSIICKVNGSSIITATDSTHKTATKHGKVAYSDTTSRFEDWSWADAASAPVLSSPTGTPTGPTQATVGVTSDTAPTATAISYQILPAATAAPSAATIVGTPDGTISTGSAGALTKDVTGLTTNTAVKVHFAQGATSNVVSSASFTPNTLAIAGTALSAQTGVAGSAFVWAGVTPESLLTNAGNGTPGTAWTATAGVGASGVTVNASTGILVAAALGTAGSYTITLQRTDASTVPGAQTVTKTVGLTISGSGAATAVTLSGPSSGTAGSASTNFTVGANGTITGTVVVTPSDSAGGGTFTPTSVSISSGSPTGTFTYTAASAGVKSISVTNGGGLSNPSAVSYTASAPSGATFTSEPLKRNNGTLAASSALDYVRWYNPTTGALVLSKTGLSTNSSGIFSTTDAALSGSTSYALDWKEATGQRRMPIKATA